MSKKSLQLGLILLALLFSQLAHGDEYLSFKDLIRLGKEELQQGRYQKAIFYFKLAHISDPASDEPRYYVNLAKRIQEGRVRLIEPGVLSEQFSQSFLEHPPEKILPHSTLPTRHESAKSQKQPHVESQPVLISQKGQVHSDIKSASVIAPSHQGGASDLQSIAQKSSGILSVSQKSLEVIHGTVLPNIVFGLEEIVLGDELKASLPRTRIQIEFNKSVILRGRNIDRFLVLTPDIVEVERVDRDRIRVIGKNRGTTLFHVWDAQMRWTLQIEVVFAATREIAGLPAHRAVEGFEEPFRFFYSGDWNSFYSGGGFETLERKSLNFTQIPSIIGNTPYGRFDSYAIFNDFKESTEVTGYGVGLTDGHFGAFKNFTVRGFDLSKRFSPLTLPGKYVRGALWEGTVLDENLEYTFLWGRDRLIFGFLGTGILERRESFVQGARMVLFPQQKHQYAINYAQGYGSAREDSLKDRAISVETQQKFDVDERFQRLLLGKTVGLNSEIAFDEQRFAKTVGTEFGEDNLKLRFNFRDIDRNYLTLSGNPPNQGEIGGNTVLNWKMEKFDVSSGLDVYRNRFIFNPQRPEAYNLDWNTDINVPLPKFANFRTSFYFVDTPQEVSPRTNSQIINNYSRTFNILGNKPLSVFIGNSYQRNRYTLSPISDFDRYGMSTGFRIPLIRSLYYSFSYDFSWVKETLTNETSFPKVYNTGLSYYTKLSDSWSGNWGFSYRKEEDASGLHSFLAGEDSITGTLGFNFYPKPDFEFFVDSQFRNVWPQSKTRDHYAEGLIRLGVRSAWDLPFHFNPHGEVRGFVFKDLNGNAQKDSSEPGIPDIKIKIGKFQVKTNDMGKFSQKVSAKKVLVEVEPESIPKGYVSTTPLFEDVEIINLGARAIDFGLTTHSGISGMVFIDKNQDGKLDEGDEFIPRVKIILDNSLVSITNYEGSFFFDDIKSGTHTIRIDVNSFPLDYLPQVKLVTQVEISEGQSYLFNIPVILRGRRK